MGHNTKRALTEQVEMHVWKAGKAILRLWALPGQSEFYVSHHFFMSTGRRGLFVIVVNLEDSEETMEYQLKHWLSIVEAKHSRHDLDNGKVNPVVIVATHLDCVPAKPDLTQLTTRYRCQPGRD